MPRRLLPILVFLFFVSALHGQDSANPAPALDSAVKSLAADVNRKFPPGENPKVALGLWTYRDSVPDLGLYWAAQLTEELAGLPGRAFTLVSGGQSAADWLISGEIDSIAGIIRVYTRIIRSGDRSIAASFHSDFEFDEYFAEMLSDGGGGSSSSAARVARDAYEPDSRENPLAVEIAAGEDGPVVGRTLHAGNDEDFFLLVPDREGALVMETTGDADTYLELYDAGSWNKIAENDDGGSGSNARIRYQAQPGGRYIAKVRGYSSGDTGSYGFRAFIVEPVRPDEYENDDDFDSAKDIDIGTPQQHTFTTGDDVDWVRFRISQAGRYTIRARGVISARLDTCIELYDAGRSLIDEDDDGGENLDARLSVRLQAGTYYLKAECLNSEPDQPYTIRIDAE